MSAELKQVDDLMLEKKYGEAEKILKKLPKNSDTIWRNARLTYAQIGAMNKEPSKSFIKEVYDQCLADLDQILEKEPNNADCLVWKGICINELSQIVGTDERIKNSWKMRELWDKAYGIDPKNYVLLSCLGTWCFTVADLPDIKRAFAKAFFSKPPESTYEEAVKYLEESMKLHPQGLIGTLIHLAKSYQALKNKEKCTEYCKKVMDFPDEGYLVAEAKEDAKKIMKKL